MKVQEVVGLPFVSIISVKVVSFSSPIAYLEQDMIHINKLVLNLVPLSTPKKKLTDSFGTVGSQLFSSIGLQKSLSLRNDLGELHDGKSIKMANETAVIWPIPILTEKIALDDD